MAGGGLAAQLFSFLPIVLIFVIFYFLIIKPQNDAAKAHGKVLEALKRGDAVLTNGGVFGVVEKVVDKLVLVQINAEDQVVVAKDAIARVLGEEEAKAVLKLRDAPEAAPVVKRR
ncbi:MAG: preprotein translocase subunit YajC [Proteobacteria bacterium]|nr:preprotein translocase subunit YajC [Pseudomonadota bacterium]NBX86647.1 preprotein translocase subunit YajC [Pseudomonadota bacterium]